MSNKKPKLPTTFYEDTRAIANSVHYLADACDGKASLHLQYIQHRKDMNDNLLDICEHADDKTKELMKKHLTLMAQTDQVLMELLNSAVFFVKDTNEPEDDDEDNEEK